jgi:hypothetical protein
VLPVENIRLKHEKLAGSGHTLKDPTAVQYGPYLDQGAGRLWTFDDPFKRDRVGVAPAVGEALQEAVPHFTYLPFLAERRGRVVLGVVASGSRGTDVSVKGYFSTVVDFFRPYRNVLFRN